MVSDEAVQSLLQAATSGASKTLVIKSIKEQFNYDDELINEILNICKLKNKPKNIEYSKFYFIPGSLNANKYNFPFTQIYSVDNFLSTEECSNLISIINQSLRPSTVADPKDTSLISDYRTSKTADLHYFSSPFINSLDWKICKFMGLDPFIGESIQSQKYAPGQYYKEHHDFFHPSTPEYKTYTEWMGQRTWSMLIYLNDVEEGGETYFKKLQLKIKPKKGLAIFWNNLYKDGKPNKKTLHEALPPISGDKYILTKWFRSWPLI